MFAEYSKRSSHTHNQDARHTRVKFLGIFIIDWQYRSADCLEHCTRLVLQVQNENIQCLHNMPLNPS